MKKSFVIIVGMSIILSTSCSKKEAVVETSENPFFTEWTTPYGVPPFDQIKSEHYRVAIDSGFKQHLEEIDAIVINPDAPTFENTILALEYSGQLLHRVSSAFFNVCEADGDDEMKAIEADYAPLFSQHEDNINLNEKLFARVKAVYEQRETLGLDKDDVRLIEHYYKNFVRGGTNLDPAKKEELKTINNRISNLTTAFGQKLLNENNKFVLIIENADDLSGLPQSSIDAAAEFAKKEDREGKWLFNTAKPSWIPFLQFADKRDLREKMYKGYINRGNNGDDDDTKAIIEEIAALRVAKANLLGFKTWADYVIDDNMAKTSKAAIDLINQVAQATIPYAKAEAAELQKLADESGAAITIEPWDWWYYTEKLRKQKYDVDEELIRPYFSLDKALNGVFMLANKLYGITFEPMDDMPVYNPEVKVYEVKDADDSHLAVIYLDYFPRKTKRAGAWMNNIKEEYYQDGKRVAPVIVNVCSFTRPTGDLPALLSLDEVETLFHEFGHGIHGMFANTKYRSTSGTNVSRDFVELPSQVMENWVLEPEFLKIYAKHYQTGEAIPDSLIQKLNASARFNQGFSTMELIAATILDLDWHTLTDTIRRNAIEFEALSKKKMGLIKEIEPRYSSWYFNHVWGSDFGYSAGYYGYTWAAVLDADAFKAFAETGDIFNPEVAKKFRKLLSTGDSEEAAILYKNFRGADPTPDAFFERKGFVKK
jgi:peptidyl-dipeptidase Dcp